MITIDNLNIWLEEYFSKPENQKKSEQAGERYDRLMVKNIRKQILSGTNQFHLSQIAADDPGKRLEKVKYETLPSVEFNSQKGKLCINLLDKTAEFIKKA